MSPLPCRTRALACLGAALLAAGCAGSARRWPAVSEPATGLSTPGRWVWAELLTDQVDSEKAFYEQVFGWKCETRGTGEESYTTVRAEGRPIAGIVHHARPAGGTRGARWLPLLSVPEAGRAAQQAASAGGRVVVPPKRLPGRGDASILEDPEGGLFAVLRADGGDPPDEFPAFGTWLWFELWAKDAPRMAEFYRPIGGYEVEAQEGPGDRPELRFIASGYPRAGVVQYRRKDLPTTWVPYVRVEDLQKTLTRVRQAGGRVIIEPGPEVREGKIAVFLDPLGAAAAVAEWRDESEREAKP